MGTMNKKRSKWCEDIIQRFIKKTGTDPQDALKDLLCDLRHWATENGIDYEGQDEAAASLHAGEVADDE